jgi:two-component system sensor histidine kinase DesK
VRAADNAALLEISDDGRGGAAAEGAGLRGMRERIEMLGGGTVQRNAARGLQLTITLPLPERAARGLALAQATQDN